MPLAKDTNESVVVVIRSMDKKFLLGERADHYCGLEFIGGRIKEGETPRFAAIREVEEESGIKISDPGMDPPVQLAPGVLLFMFWLPQNAADLPPTFDKPHVNMDWLDTDKLLRQPVSRFYPWALPVVGWLLTQRLF